MSEISPGYNPANPDPDDPSNRDGWALWDYAARLEEGVLDVADLTKRERDLLSSKGLIP